MAEHKDIAFFESGSWYHRVRVLRPDGSTCYRKRGGFQTKGEAEIRDQV